MWLALPMNERYITALHAGPSGDVADAVSPTGRSPKWLPPRGALQFHHMPGHAPGQVCTSDPPHVYMYMCCNVQCAASYMCMCCKAGHTQCDGRVRYAPMVSHDTTTHKGVAVSSHAHASPDRAQRCRICM